MNIIIPMGGLGERFSKEKYSVPKPMIYCRGKPMIYWLIDNLNIMENDLVIIPYTAKLDVYGIKDLIKSRNKNILTIPIPVQTSSSIDTVAFALRSIPEDRNNYKTISLDCDTFYTSDILSTIMTLEDKCYILYKLDENIQPIYSYIEMDSKNKIIDIREKEKISDNACIGCYVFSSLQTLKDAIENIDYKSINRSEKYMSDVYSSMINRGIEVYGVPFNDVCCIGTPMQLKLFGSEKIESETPKRFCFDLDNTLVTRPAIENDYSTVKPIDKNIRFLQFLKSLGHTIIIYTARRMRTHGGRCGRVVADIGKLTFDTLDKFNIPYDEIYFGKPDADFYIDDKAINCLREDLEKETGFYSLSGKERSFNYVTSVDNKIVKSSKNRKILGEVHWYSNIPYRISHLFPEFYGYEIKDEVTSYTIERIRGIPMSHLYINDCMTGDHLTSILKNLNDIHTSSDDNDINAIDNIDIYELYTDKLIDRLSEFDYTKFSGSDVIVKNLLIWYERYKDSKMARVGVIHGDPVFSNILLDECSQLKFLDMRGICGNKLTIYGDIFYDYAKVFQSLMGYDHIVAGKEYPIYHERYFGGPIYEFINYFKRKFSSDHLMYIYYITIGLFFTLIPLHDEDTQCKLYDHMLKIIDELIYE